VDFSDLQPEITIFKLPPGYRPAAKEVFSAMSSVGAYRVNVTAGGPVIADAHNLPDWLALDGITFRCAPSERHGCP
jgi:hypothetical protein